MLKARNILIIFILNYIIILLACAVLETFFVSNTAQQVQMMMQTAADMALDQVQATDDFFTTGMGYFKGDNKLMYKNTDISIGAGDDSWRTSAYSIATINKQNKLTKVDFFGNLTGVSVSGTENTDVVHTINNRLYPKKDIENFIDKNEKIKDMSIYGAVVTVDNTTLEMDNRKLTVAWFSVPKIYQLSVYNSSASLSSDLTCISPGITTNLSARLSTIVSNYELNQSNSTFTDSSGKTIYYSKTPLSIGITYINEKVLQYLYMNNLQLLMRAKYAGADGQLPFGEAGGQGVYTGSSYSNYVDNTTLEAANLNPINNGKFTLLLGNQVKQYKVSDSESYDILGDLQLYEGLTGRMPKIEYAVIDMYDNENNSILQAVLGPMINTSAGLVETTGDNLWKTDLESIAYYKRVVLGMSESDSKSLTKRDNVFDHKYMVVAKVTFYADVIIPYQTVGLREMRIRERVDNSGNHADLSARTLFDPFSDVAQFMTTGTPEATKYNYGDIITSMGDGGVDLDGHLSEDVNSYLSGLYNYISVKSDPMVYTTFFAVTP